MIDALLLAAHMVTVRPGDTLYAISPGHRWQTVCQENRIQNCDLIYPGQRIKVGGSWTASRIADPPRRLPHHHRTHVWSKSVQSGTLSCSGLERLWTAAGGNSGSAYIAAEIAMAESGGRQYATGPVGERGYWQIHPLHGSLSTYNAYGNARAAIIISGNGSNWSPWTTYTSGAYHGRCLE
jgi:Lysozyme like domain/LysM domain